MRRSAFTIIELLVVVVVAGVMMMIALPKFEGARASASLRSAKNAVVSHLAAARATAIRRGANAYFVRTGNSISVLIDSASVKSVVLRSTQLDSAYQVTLSATGTSDTIRFDMRGTGRLAGTAGVKYTLVRGTLRDSVCLSPLGMVSLRACSL